MTTMTDCLVAFTVASGMQNADAAERGVSAIDAYLAGFEGDAVRCAAALRELQDVNRR